MVATCVNSIARWTVVLFLLPSGSQGTATVGLPNGRWGEFGGRRIELGERTPVMSTRVSCQPFSLAWPLSRAPARPRLLGLVAGAASEAELAMSHCFPGQKRQISLNLSRICS